MRIGIIAALPGELNPLVKRWDRLPSAKLSGVKMWQRPEKAGTDQVIAVCAGMGAPAARRAFAAAEFLGALDVVLSVGWAGALIKAQSGCLVASEVIDAQTGERFLLTSAERRLRVVTTVSVVARADKQRLEETYSAVAVDMEAAVVARLAEMRGIPMCCFKGISDGLDASLPDINPFIDSSGKLRMTSFLGHVALRPQYWGSMMEMGRRSSSVAKDLAVTVEAFLRDPDAERWNAQGGAKY